MIDKIITIGFSRPKGKLFPLFSWLIRLFEGVNYSHVFLKWTSNAGPTVVYEASGARVRFMNASIFNKSVTVVHEYKFIISPADYRKLIKFTMTNVGTNYGMLQVFGMALTRLFNLKKNPFGDGKSSQVCSETVAYFLQDVLGYEILFDKEVAGPRLLREFIEKTLQENVNVSN